MSFEEMISGRDSGHSSTDDDHIGIGRDCLRSPVPDQWVIPRTLEPKRERGFGMRESHSRSVGDRMHPDGTGRVQVVIETALVLVVDCELTSPVFFTHGECTKVSGCGLLFTCGKH